MSQDSKTVIDYSTMNIFQKMLIAQTKIGVVEKSLEVKQGKNQRSYKAVCERDILDAVKPIEAEVGIYSYQVNSEIVEMGIRTTSNGYDQNYIKLKVTYRFVNVEKPDEFIEIDSYGTGLDSGDKLDGKAMTYAKKYALMNAYKISTGDDPDKDASLTYNESIKKMEDEYNYLVGELNKCGYDLRDEKIATFFLNKTGVSTVAFNRDDLNATKRLIDQFNKTIGAVKGRK